MRARIVLEVPPLDEAAGACELKEREEAIKGHGDLGFHLKGLSIPLAFALDGADGVRYGEGGDEKMATLLGEGGLEGVKRGAVEKKGAELDVGGHLGVGLCAELRGSFQLELRDVQKIDSAK